MKPARIALIVAVVAVLLVLALILTRRWAKPEPVATPGRAAPAAALSPAQPPRDTTPPDTRLTPPRGYLALSAAIDSGALPEPLPPPRGAPDRQASELASAVFAKDSNSTAALYAAVLASGYAVRKRDGSIVRTLDPGQGIVLEEFEVAGMAKLYGLGYGVTLKHLGDSFRQAEPWKDLKLEELMLDGLRHAAFDSTPPEVKFWALFITELGRRSREPFDLLGKPDPAKSRLDAIQLQLLLTRAAADYAVLHPQRSSAAPAARISLASWPPVESSASAPCDMGTWGDYAAIGVTTGFGKLADMMGGGAARYGQAVQRANLMLVLAKFIATYALLDQELHIGGGVLTRTKTMEPGDSTRLSDRVNIEDSWTQYVNCARQILNANGLDLTLPNSGPIKNVRVWWDIELGRETLVFFPYALGGPAGGGMSTTNSEGIAQAAISGLGQAQDLSRRRIVRVDKTASVRTSAQVKSTKLESLEDVAGTAGDYGSLVIAFFTGDPLGAVAGLVTENFYRSAWGYSEPFEFTVIDWEPCENVWSGTIDYWESFIKVGSGTRPGVNQHLWNEIETYSAHTTITQSRKDAEPAGQSRADVTFSRLNFSTGLNDCYYVNDEVMTLKGSRDANAYLNVSISSNGDYMVGYTLPVVEAAGTSTASSKKEGHCNNPFNMGKTQTTDESQSISPEANLDIKGHVDPDAPDALSGTASEEREIRDGVRRANVRWALKRCPGNLN